MTINDFDIVDRICVIRNHKIDGKEVEVKKAAPKGRANPGNSGGGRNQGNFNNGGYNQGTFPLYPFANFEPDTFPTNKLMLIF